MTNSDVPAPGGWTQLLSARVAKKLYVGTASLLAVLWVYGNVNVTGVLNFSQTAGTQTGAVLQVGSLTRYQTFPVTCVASGGALTSACYARSPLTTSGTLLAFGGECGNWAVAMTGDFSFKKTKWSATGTVLAGGNNLTFGTGANVQSVLAAPVTWNPADLLTFTSLTAPTGTVNSTRYNCQMWATISDKYGS